MTKEDNIIPLEERAYPNLGCIRMEVRLLGCYVRFVKAYPVSAFSSEVMNK